jgi:hypothetical protein
MRNAVIRRKLIQEQVIIRRYLFAPQRLIVPTTDISWDEYKNASGRLWVIR